MATTPNILIVDKDLPLRIVLNDYLSTEGFFVKTISSTTEIKHATGEHVFTLAIIDITNENDGGLSACQQLLQHCPDKIGLILLSENNNEHERVVALENEADDFLVKPFSYRELLARIRSVLRRTANISHTSRAQEKLIRFGKYKLNATTRHLTKLDADVQLTSGEFELLNILAERPNQLLSRDMLTTLARGRESGSCERSVDVLISRLRKTIEPDPKNPVFIQTVWGRGYIFVPSAEETSNTPL